MRPGTFDHTVLDDCRTEGLDAAEKPLGPPDRDAALLRLSGAARHHLHLSLHTGGSATPACKCAWRRPSSNMFAAGEIMAGNVLGKGYTAGVGMTIGSVFGEDRRRRERHAMLAS